MKPQTARDIMNPNVKTINDEMTVHELASFFTEHMISGAPVIDKSGQPIGVVSLSDIVRGNAMRSSIVKSQHESNYFLHGLEDSVDAEELQVLHLEEDDGLTVRSIMTPSIFKVADTASVYELADIMIGGRIHRLLVTKNDRIVGIVTTLDLVRALRDHDESEQG